jgi:hypothetical protein
VIADLATPPNFAAGVTRTVLADNIAPTLTGVTYKTTDVAPASLVIDAAGNVGGAAVAATSVQYVSKAPGAAGNGYTVQYVAGAGATESITVSPTGLVVTTRAGGSTPSQIAAIVNASVASAAVTATAVLPASTSTIVAAGPAPLLGGSSNVTLTITYSEVVRQGSRYGANSTAPSRVGSAFVTASHLWRRHHHDHARSMAPPTCIRHHDHRCELLRPGAGAQFTASPFGGIEDLAGNDLVPVTVTMTAAP